MAAELLSLYASRELSEGHSFALDTPWQVQLEDAFPYEETPDQAEAILDMKRDMESVRPMDRLICGDVGYGKTEVALRAAFKAVTDGLQVAILVPTTVLAQQHFTTFSERLKPYPVRVEVLSRFRTDREQRDIVSDLAEGRSISSSGPTASSRKTFPLRSSDSSSWTRSSASASPTRSVSSRCDPRSTSSP